MVDARPPFPFVALVGQEDMRLGLLLNVVAPRVGGLLLFGDRGTGKSTAVRSLACALPRLQANAGCWVHCDPDDPCAECQRGGRRAVSEIPVPVVDLPLGATDDRVTGSLDLEAALVRGEKRFEPGLLARAHRGFLYVDEVNLLEDHLVDLLLDVASSGELIVEREGLSARHPARFVLVGSGNPEEGELRPQLLDRFGLCVDIVTETDPQLRVEITKRRLAYDDDPVGFAAAYERETSELRARLIDARTRVGSVTLDDTLLESIAALNAELEIPGHRGELTLARAAKAHAALAAQATVTVGDVRRVASMALTHRRRRDPLSVSESAERLESAIVRHFGRA